MCKNESEVIRCYLDDQSGYGRRSSVAAMASVRGDQRRAVYLVVAFGLLFR